MRKSFVVSNKIYTFAATYSPRFPLEQRAQGESFFCMLMNKIAYPKEQKSFDEQIALLKQRGMYFEDEVRANCILQNVSYYRLSGYWYPLLKDKQRHIFKDGASFDNAYSIYKFDSALRKLVLSEIEKIEIAVRTQFSYIMSQEYDGWWFTDGMRYYHVPIAHRSKAWLLLYYFGLQPIVLKSWITSLTLLRNACIGASGMGIDVTKVTLLPRKPLCLAGKV